jgi:hypothetical protein
MKVRGSKELRARLVALKRAFKPIGRKWGRAAIDVGRPLVPIKTGRLRRSMRITSNTQTKTRVGAHYSAYFVDKGPVAHTILPRRAKRLAFQVNGRTVYARKVHHRGYRGRPFRKRMAEEGLRRTPMAEELIRQWNEAA